MCRVIDHRKTAQKIAAAQPHHQGNGLSNDTFLLPHMEKLPTPGQAQPLSELACK